MNFRVTVKSFYRCDVTEVFLPSILGLIESFCMYNILGIAKSLYYSFEFIAKSFYYFWKETGHSIFLGILSNFHVAFGICHAIVLLFGASQEMC